jgi:hypothetical protein
MEGSTIMFTVTLALAAMFAGQEAPQGRAESLGKLLTTGRLAETEGQLTTELAAKPDDAARMTLGMTKFLRAIEDYARTMRRFGLNHRASVLGSVPFFRIPVPAHPNPSPVRAEDLRAMFAKLVKDLDAAEATLAPISTADWKVVVQAAAIQLNVADQNEQPVPLPLADLLGLAGFAPRGVTQNQPPEIVVAFDKSDAVWLRGYCRLLQGLAEVVLGYDAHELFDHSAHLAFAKPVGKYPFLQGSGGKEFDQNWIIDGIAFIHMLRVPVKEPERLKSAHGRFLQMLDLSGKMWDEILAETDSDREWIPSPKQKGAIPNVTVNDAMIGTWREFLAEGKAMLEGKKLAPFWRDSADAQGVRGINLKRVFHEPQMFDLVLWIQGTAAVPYLENGPTTSPATWRRFSEIFQGRFFTFFVWWN